MKQASARKVIVSAGAINSPQLLLLSGVGPAIGLQKLGIPVVHGLPDAIFGNTNGPSLMIGFPGADLIRNSNR